MKNSFFTIEEGVLEVVVIKRLDNVSKGPDKNTKQQLLDSPEPLRYVSPCRTVKLI